jgi:excisionase family DNA binding protein
VIVSSQIDEQTGAIPGTVTVPEAASLLGVSKSAAYRAIEARLAGDIEAWPTNVIRIGRTLRIPSVELRALLGFDPAA